MLKFFKRRTDRRELEPYHAASSVADDNPELHIRDLRDNPRLRRAMGLDEYPSVSLAA